MGVFSDQLEHEVRLERMRPEEIEAAKAKRPAVYAAFGSIEWHGRHNPVGLDAVKAHEQLVGLAVRVGGVVYPPVFFGAGGGHLDWPHTLMTGAEPMIRIVLDLLNGFDRNGFRAAILLSGHYPNRNAFLDPAIEEYRKAGGTMAVLPLVETQVPDGKGDHAALYETSFMLYLHPETVDAAALQDSGKERTGPETMSRNWMGPEYRDHPCYGLVGIDPRGHASAEIGRAATENVLAYLHRWLDRTAPVSRPSPFRS